MATISKKPAILFIQGSFQKSKVYQSLVDSLKGQGYQVAFPALPSITGQDHPDFPKQDLASDATVIKSTLKTLVETEDKSVVVLMHSYGGLVGTEGIAEEMTYKSRQNRGLEGGVSHLIFYAAFLLSPGQSVLNTWGEAPLNDILPDGRYIIKTPKTALYSGLPDEEAERWANEIVPQSHAVESTVLTRASFEYLPSTYIVCTEDQACPPDFQRMFGAQARSKVLEMAAGHSPHLSHLDELVKLVDTAIQDL